MGTSAGFAIAVLVLASCRGREKSTPPLAALDASSEAAALAFCPAMKAASETVAARLPPTDPMLRNLDFLRCAEGEGGAWALRVDDAIVTHDESGTEVVGFAVVLVHRDASGGLTKYDLPSKTLPVDGGRSVAASETHLLSWGALRLTDFAIGAVDADRDPEVFVAGGVFEEGSREMWGKLLTFHDGRIEEYSPAKGIDVVAVADVDGDGRIDLRTRGPYATIEEWTAVPAKRRLFVDGILLAHTLPDGTFSFTDDVARAEARKTCPAAAASALANAYSKDDAPLQLLCARVFGASATRVKQLLTPHCRTFVDTVSHDGECSKALLTIADTTPPLTLGPERSPAVDHRPDGG